jgi:Uma2 family endonuclease
MSATATKSAVPELAAMAMFPRLTVKAYHDLIANGTVREGEPIELIEGLLVPKMSRGSPHDSAIDFLDEYLVPLVPAGWFARSQRAVTLADSEPEPDYAVVRGPRSRYRGHHPLAAEVSLVIEVSDSSLGYDRVHKARIYARAGIPVYWIVNVIDKQIEVLTQPSGPCDTPAYAQTDVYVSGASVPVALDGTTVGTIAVADVVG